MRTATVPDAPAQAVPASTTSWQQFAFCLGGLALVWFEVIRHLQNEWSYNPQYNYGWGVPVLVAFMLWRRWLTRPAPQPASSQAWPVLFIFLFAAFFLPGRFLGEANPDWRLLSWMLSLAGVAVSLGMLWLVGGRPWVRHFAFPFCFFLVAVPWPALAEQLVTQNLMRAVTAINVIFLNIVGIPALRLGNVIEVGSGLIGIEEACSGVRSLQATIMVSLFLGELYAFNITRRIVLLLAGALLAFICNLVRTGVLVWVGANRGAGAISAWHDPAGLSILLVCLFGLWVLSLAMQRYFVPAEQSPARSDYVGSWRFPSQIAVAIGVWLLLVEAGVQAWYHAHQSATQTQRWRVRWPVSAEAFKTIPIAPEAESLLRYNEGGGGSWTGTDGHSWIMYFFRWLPGRTAALFVKIHRPDICLPASGMTLVSDNGFRTAQVNGVNLPIRSYRFDDHGTPRHVYYCYWDARSSYQTTAAANEEDWSARGRIRAAMRGLRERGAQMLEIVVSGYEDDEEAAAAFREQVSRLLIQG